MSDPGLIDEVVMWVGLQRPLICGTTMERLERPHPDDVNAAEQAGLIIRDGRRWDLTEDGELHWYALQGAMAGAR